MSTNKPENPYTTLNVQKTTRDKLNELGKKGETYDSVILRLIHKAERKKVM